MCNVEGFIRQLSCIKGEHKLNKGDGELCLQQRTAIVQDPGAMVSEV